MCEFRLKCTYCMCQFWLKCTKYVQILTSFKKSLWYNWWLNLEPMQVVPLKWNTIWNIGEHYQRYNEPKDWVCITGLNQKAKLELERLRNSIFLPIKSAGTKIMLNFIAGNFWECRNIFGREGKICPMYTLYWLKSSFSFKKLKLIFLDTILSFPSFFFSIGGNRRFNQGDGFQSKGSFILSYIFRQFRSQQHRQMYFEKLYAKERRNWNAGFFKCPNWIIFHQFKFYPVWTFEETCI